MLFNSFVFVGFFAVVYALYLALGRSMRAQNYLLLVASYIFYGYWDARFLLLLAASTVVDFYAARKIGSPTASGAAGRRRRSWLVLSLAANLSLLGIFKYYGFFVDSFAAMLAQLGMQSHLPTLRIVLPVGISFYTFQTMSYTIDVYRGRLEAAKSLPDFALFISFFPQLVAGPIERAVALLPQIVSPRHPTAEQIETGLFLILWGFYKKVVIADNLALIANPVFNDYRAYSGLDILLATLAFTFQIYCDFSGYTDIARGVARLMGFELMLNFRLPYFARTPSDFWRRWHISLSSWLKDYLYVPLGGNRHGRLATYRNLFLTMLIGGLWHGAAWNFVLWGAFHGALLILYRLLGVSDAPARRWWTAVPQMAVMFGFTLVGWLIFRASSAEQIGYMLSHVSLAPSAHSAPWIGSFLFLVTPLLLVQLAQARSGDLLILTKLPAWVRAPVYGAISLMILLFGVGGSSQFIYFQF